MRTPHLLRVLGAITALGWLLPSTARAAATVSCTTTVSTYSWYPLPLNVIGRVVEGRVLQAVTASGKITLQPAGKPGQPDLELVVTARIIEDAGQFSVFASAVPRRQARVGSVAAVATRSIEKKDHKGIQQEIERAADEAGKRLATLLEPGLDRMMSDATADRLVPPETRPLDWGDLARLGGRRKGLKLRRGQTAQSLQLVDQLSFRARKESAARLALADCALSPVEVRVRRGCIDALAQLAKRHPFAQRAIIAVLLQEPPRKDTREWFEARRDAFKVSTTFEGVALEEAIQAWLYILGSDHSDDYQLFGHRREDMELLHPIADYLARRPEVPNLDRALARCAGRSKHGDSPDEYCLRVMSGVPLERRLSLLHRELHEPPIYSHYDAWKGWVAMFQRVVERGKPLHPAVEKLCRYRIERSFDRPDRSECLEWLGASGRPTTELVDFLLRVFISAEPDLAIPVHGALDKLVARAPALCPHLVAQLRPRVKERAYPIHYVVDEVPRFYKRCLSEARP